MQHRDNPRRPPKKWMNDCIEGVEASAGRERSSGTGSSRAVRDPGAVCGALWYQKMSPTAKRAALAREGKAANPGPMPSSGWAIASSSKGYDSYYETKGEARKAAQELANRTHSYVDLVRITKTKGRFIVDMIEPNRSSNPWARVFG